jgi:hypothetical protein
MRWSALQITGCGRRGSGASHPGAKFRSAWLSFTQLVSRLTL